MKNLRSMTLAFVLGAGAISALAAPVPVGDVLTAIVRVDDLDLGKEHGVRILYQRLQLAAEAVCPGSARDALRAARARACQADALDRAVDVARLPQLTALHQRQQRQDPRRVAGR